MVTIIEEFKATVYEQSLLIHPVQLFSELIDGIFKSFDTIVITNVVLLELARNLINKQVSE